MISGDFLIEYFLIIAALSRSRFAFPVTKFQTPFIALADISSTDPIDLLSNFNVIIIGDKNLRNGVDFQNAIEANCNLLKNPTCKSSAIVLNRLETDSFLEFDLKSNAKYRRVS